MTADPRTINVSCPHCGARYLLPANLLGPGGARVRCPGCSRSFDVPPAASQAAAAAATPVPPAATPAPAGARTLQETPRRPSIAAPAPTATPATADARAPEEVARALLSALIGPEGGPLSAAAAEGSLFSKHGPAIFGAFDEFRRRVPGAGAAPFRAALRELWGVELPEVTPRP